MNEILQEAGITISETTIVYAIAIAVILLTLVALFTGTKNVKAILKTTAEVILTEHKLTDEKIEKMYDDLVSKIKVVLKKPDKSGKVPLINKLLIVLVSVPITKKFVLKQVNNFLDELELEECKNVPEKVEIPEKTETEPTEEKEEENKVEEVK